MIGIGSSLLFDRRSGKGGSPIPPFNDALVDAWFMSGLSNNDKPSSIRGVKGNNLALKNFAYSLSSGFGKYEVDFNSWRTNNNISYRNSIEFKAEFNKDEIRGRKYFLQHPDTEKINSFRIKVISNHTAEDIYELEYRYLNSDKQIQYFKISSDGEYTLPASFPTDETEVTYTNKLGFAYSTYSLKDISFTITQLPSAYEGALVFDGVDDYGICNNLPILTDYTVICRRVIENDTNVVASKSIVAGNGAFIFEYGNNATYSFSEYTSGLAVNLEDSVSWQTKNSYNGSTITVGNADDTDTLTLGIIREGDSRLLEGAIYYFALYNKSLTPEEIEEEKTRLNDEWKRRLGKEDEDPAWYTDALVCEYNPIKQGCTNQNMSTDNVLRDLSGNGYHMNCYNFAWNAQSGIYDDGSLKLDGVDDYLKVTGLPIMDDFTVMAQSYKYTTPPNVLASKSYPTANDGAFILGNVDHAGRGSLRSFGNNNWVTYIQETINVIAMTKTECYKDFDNNVSFYVTPGTGVDSDILWIGRIRDNNSVLGNIRLYSFLMFNRSLTKEEMDWVRNNKMNK